MLALAFAAGTRRQHGRRFATAARTGARSGLCNRRGRFFATGASIGLHAWEASRAA